MRSFASVCGEKAGCITRSASLLMNSTKSLKVTDPSVPLLNSKAWRHHLTQLYEGSFELTCNKVSVELSSSRDLIVFMLSLQRMR